MQVEFPQFAGYYRYVRIVPEGRDTGIDVFYGAGAFGVLGLVVHALAFVRSGEWVVS